LDSIQAAVLNVKLKYLDQYNASRHEAAQKYNAHFQNVTGIITPLEVPYSHHVFHQYTLRIPDGHRDGVKKALETHQIPFGIYYPVPLNQQHAFKWKISKHGNCSRSIELTNDVISLPMHTELTDEMSDHIAEIIIHYFS